MELPASPVIGDRVGVRRGVLVYAYTLPITVYGKVCIRSSMVNYPIHTVCVCFQTYAYA